MYCQKADVFEAKLLCESLEQDAFEDLAIPLSGYTYLPN